MLIEIVQSAPNLIEAIIHDASGTITFETPLPLGVLRFDDGNNLTCYLLPVSCVQVWILSLSFGKFCQNTIGLLVESHQWNVADLMEQIWCFLQLGVKSISFSSKDEWNKLGNTCCLQLETGKVDRLRPLSLGIAWIKHWLLEILSVERSWEFRFNKPGLSHKSFDCYKQPHPVV